MRRDFARGAAFVLSFARRHGLFLIAFAMGLVAGLGSYRLAGVDRILIGADVFFAGYLLIIAAKSSRIDPAHFRKRGFEGDEGVPFIAMLSLAAVVVSLGAIVVTMRATDQGFALRPLLALASVPLGWMTIHLVMAFHYAGLWYARDDGGRDAGGLAFPAETPDPELWDFIYYSFTIGMTAQTSDVAVKTTSLRRITVLHGALSYFYNAVILALAVNLALTLGR